MARAGLTPAVVTLAAADLADAHGWQQLTLASVAEELGVRQPSLYKHISSLASLRQAVSQLAITELAAHLGTAVAGRAGFDALTSLSQTYRNYALQHPGRYQASVSAPREDDEEHVRVSQALLATLAAVLRGYGITERSNALHEIRSLRALLHGFVSLEAEGGFGLDLDTGESFSRLIAGFDHALRRDVNTTMV